MKHKDDEKPNLDKNEASEQYYIKTDANQPNFYTKTPSGMKTLKPEMSPSMHKTSTVS